MARILDLRNSVDQTIRIFDDFYAFKLIINGDEYDIVHSYFISVCDAKSIADNFTVYLFRISQETGTPVLTLLDYIKGTTKLDMNRLITYYLNSFKSKTSLYGISFVPQANQPVARNIVQ
jgi:hypothetical protein